MFKIGWNDGHTLTGVGTGAVGIIKETDRNRAIGARAREILLNEYEGIEIINCTIDKSNNDMAEAVKIANNAKCDVFISNHANKGGGVGFEGFYSRFASNNDIAKGKVIYDRLVATKSCLANRRYCSDYSYLDYDLYVLKNTAMSAYLFEIGFIDNQECVNAVNNEEVARAYAEGLATAYELKKKSKVEVITPQPDPVQTPPTQNKKEIDSFIKVDGYPWVKNLEDYAGVFGVPVKNFYAYPSESEILFRVSPVNKDYYPWVQNYQTSSGKYDFAGNGVPIDRLQIKLKGLPEHRIKYRVHLLNGAWLPWVYDDTDYAGIRGRMIDAIEVEIV